MSNLVTPERAGIAIFCVGLFLFIGGAFNFDSFLLSPVARRLAGRISRNAARLGYMVVGLVAMALGRHVGAEAAPEVFALIGVFSFVVALMAKGLTRPLDE